MDELYLLIGFMYVFLIPFLSFWLFRRQSLGSNDVHFLFALFWGGLFFQAFSANYLAITGTFSMISAGGPILMLAIMGIRVFSGDAGREGVLFVYRVRVSRFWALMLFLGGLLAPLFVLYTASDNAALIPCIFALVMIIACIAFRSRFPMNQQKYSTSFSSHTVGQFAALLIGGILVNCLLWYEALFKVHVLTIDLRFLLLVFYYASLFLLFFRPGRKELETREQPVLPVEARVSSVVSSDGMADVVNLIESKLVGDRLFLSSLISLDVVSRETGVSRHLLSQAFSLHYGQSFYQLISALRIQYAVSSMQLNPGELGVERLSEVCGFNSRASFNKHFRAHTGCTPSAYQKRLLTSKGKMVA
jgi:AraC-like DNA-binding protein